MHFEVKYSKSSQVKQGKFAEYLSPYEGLFLIDKRVNHKI